MDIFKKFVILLLFIFGITALSSAQQDSTNTFNRKKKIYPKHEIGLSYGAFPSVGVFDLDNHIDVYTGFGYVRFGTLNAQYRLYLNHINSFNFNFSWAVYQHTLAVRQSGIYKNSNVHHLTFQVGYSVHYLNRDAVSLYSSIYYGFVLSSLGKIAENQMSEIVQWSSNNTCIFNYALQLTFMGIRFGRNHAANIELGYGNQGVFNIGYNYKF